MLVITRRFSVQVQVVTAMVLVLGLAAAPGWASQRPISQICVEAESGLVLT